MFTAMWNLYSLAMNAILGPLAPYGILLILLSATAAAGYGGYRYFRKDRPWAAGFISLAAIGGISAAYFATQAFGPFLLTS